MISGSVKARRGARIAAITCGGAIPELGDFRVVTEKEGTFVGTVNEDFALESNIGDIFLLGNTSWRVLYVRGSVVYVNDAQGAPATVPFWLGEAPGRTIELSQEISRLREDLEKQVVPCIKPGGEPEISSAVNWLQHELGIDPFPAMQAVRYTAAQFAALGVIPTLNRIVFERFFDESGGTQLVIHAPWGARINRAWGLAFRKRFCRSFDFELQASADEDGIVLSLGPQHSFPLQSLFGMLTPENGRHLLEQALLAAPVFQTRWRWCVTRALTVLRNKHGAACAAKFAAIPQRRFAGGSVSSASRLLGKSSRRYGDPRPSVYQTDLRGLLARSDGCRSLDRGAGGHSQQQD